MCLSDKFIEVEMDNSVKNGKKITSDFMLYALATLIVPMLGILIYPISTKAFSPEIYGSFSYWRVIIEAIALLTVSWITPVIYRYLNIAGQKYAVNKIRIFHTIMFFSTVYSGISIFLIVWTKNYLIAFISTDVLFLTLANYFLDFYKTNNRAKKYCILTIFRAITTYGLFLILIRYNIKAIVTLFIGSTVFNALLVIINAVLANKKDLLQERLPDRHQYSEIFKFGFPFIIINISGLILNSGDRILIKNLLINGEYYLGVYSVNYNIYSRLITVFIVAVSSLIPSYLYRCYDEGNITKFKEGLKNLITGFMIMTSVVHLYIFINYKNINYFLIDRAYIDDKNTPVVLCGAYIFFGLYQITGSYFVACKKTNYLSLFVIASGLTNIVLNIIFIPKLGYQFAAFSTLVCFIAVYLACNYLVKRKLGRVVSKTCTVLIIFNLFLIILSYWISIPILFTDKAFTILYLMACFFIETTIIAIAVKAMKFDLSKYLKL